MIRGPVGMRRVERLLERPPQEVDPALEPLAERIGGRARWAFGLGLGLSGGRGRLEAPCGVQGGGLLGEAALPGLEVGLVTREARASLLQLRRGELELLRAGGWCRARYGRGLGLARLLDGLVAAREVRAQARAELIGRHRGRVGYVHGSQDAATPNFLHATIGGVAHLRLIEPDDAEGDLREQYEAGIARAGKVFNIVKSMSVRPGVLRQSMDLYRVIMFGPSGLSRAERELLATVVSAANECRY